MIDQKETLAEKFIKKWIWLYIFSFMTWPISYIVKIVLSHDLSVEEMWVIYWVISLITILVIYHDLGLTEALNFFLPKFIVEKDFSRFKSVLAYALLAQLPTSILVWWILYFGSDKIWNWYFHSPLAVGVLKIFSLFFVLMNLFTIVNTVYWASQNTKYQKWTEFLRMFSILIATLIYSFTWKWNLANYSWNWIMWLCVWIIFSYILFYFKYYKVYLKWVKVFYDKELFKKLFSYSFWVLLAVNVWTVLSQIDTQLIIYMLWVKEVGYYTIYLSIIWIPFLIISPIIWFLFPVISELNSKWDIERIKMVKTMFYKYFSSIWVIVSFLMFSLSSEIAVTLFGNNYEKSWEILAYSIFFLAFNFLLQINFQLLAWIGQIKKRVRILAIWIFINVPLNLILIPKFGASWSSLAVWLSWIPIFMLSHEATKKYLNRFDFSFLFKNIFISLILSILILYSKKFIPFPEHREEMLFYILIIWFLYIIPFVVFNMKEWKMFFWELRRLRKKS